MKSISTYVAAAALTVGGFTFVGCDRGETASTTTTTTTTTGTPDSTTTDRRTTTDDKMDATARDTGDAAGRAADSVGDAAQTAGNAVKSAGSKIGGAVGDLANPNPSRIPGVLAEVAEAALTKDGIDDVVERFVDADRNRIGQGNLGSGNEALNGIIDQISKDWQTKYNAKFDIQNVENVYGAQFMTVQAGELGKNAGGVSVDVDTDRKVGGGAEATVDVDRKTGVDNPADASADANRNDPGRNVANLNIAASHGSPALQVPLIHEAGGWKIDVPDSVDAAKLRSNLVAHLTAVQNMKAQWPATADEAYRAVTHHVLMAVMDKPAK